MSIDIKNNFYTFSKHINYLHKFDFLNTNVLELVKFFYGGIKMDVKNKIITISGEPVTGKGTNVKAIKEKLIKKGYKEENIHIITTGHEFRRYFEVIMDFVRNIDNEEKLKALYEREEIKSIFNNSDYKNKFTKELAKLKQSRKDFTKTLSIEQANNTPELSGIREIVDTLIDQNVVKLGIEINKKRRPEEVWIVDSRLAFNNIPKSFKVRLTCRPEVAGQRLLGDNTRGKEDSKYKNLQDAINQREKRRIGEIERYKQRYGVDLSNENNYDVIIDTSYASINDISDTILTCLNAYQNNEKVSKYWTSPKVFIPTQKIGLTCGVGFSGFTLDELTYLIQKRGFNQKCAIEVAEVEDVMYIMDGHHRNFALVQANKTLVPYYKLNDVAPFMMETAKSDLKSRNMISNLHDHEMIIGRDFHYSQIYPHIY